jgi:hypothetical protein
MKLSKLNLAHTNSNLIIIRDRDINVIQYHHFYAHRLGDKVGAAGLMQYYKHGSNVAIVAVDCRFAVNGVNAGIDIADYFDNIYDAIIQVYDEKHFNIEHHYLSSQSNIMCVNGYIWELLPIIKRDHNIFPKMNMPNIYKDWWLSEKTKYGIDNYICVHILIDALYNVSRNHDIIYMIRLVNELSKYVPIVLVGISNRELITGDNIYDLTKYNYNIDQSIAIVENSFLYIGGDTGLSHAAGALGKKVVAIYGQNPYPGTGWDSIVSVPDKSIIEIRMNDDHSFDVEKVVNEIKVKFLDGAI